MKNLIVIEGKENYQYDNLEMLIENFISNNYFSMSKQEKENVLEIRTVANTIMNNIKTKKLNRYPEDFDDDAFILHDEITYILSMLKFNKFMLLERTEANIFGKYMNKEWIEENYIIINKFADEILKKYLEEKFKWKD